MSGDWPGGSATSSPLPVRFPPSDRSPRLGRGPLAGPTVRGPLEPDMHLARAHGSFVLAVGPPRRLATRATDRRGHHQVVAEVPLRRRLPVLRHPVDDPGVVAVLHHREHALVGLVTLA